MRVIPRIAWTLWALVPVAVIAFHFEAGQHLMARETATATLSTARALDAKAADLQAIAYAHNVATIAARRATFLPDANEEDTSELERALEAERATYAAAAEGWDAAAAAWEHLESQLNDVDSSLASRVQWSKGRAMVRAGSIWDGALVMESLVMDLDDSPGSPDHELARAAREELGVAHYFAASLLRLQGKPATEWRPEVIKARQHFRYLAESASEEGADPTLVGALEDNVERAINLEQMDHSELEGRPLPQQSPKMARPGKKKGQRPGRGTRPGEQDGRGAGRGMPFGPGW